MPLNVFLNENQFNLLLVLVKLKSILIFSHMHCNFSFCSFVVLLHIWNPLTLFAPIWNVVQTLEHNINCRPLAASLNFKHMQHMVQQQHLTLTTTTRIGNNMAANVLQSEASRQKTKKKVETICKLIHQCR